MRFTFLLGILIVSGGMLFSQTNDIPGISDDSAIIANWPNQKIKVQPKKFLSPLPEKVKENSGLIFWKGKVWTHNDSGGNPEIYGIDTSTGQIFQTIRLLNAKNEDWEDITQDEMYIYIGDVGNNRGTRSDLKIYKIPKSEIPVHGDAEIVDWEQIDFKYSDQQVFDKRMNKHDFDCESISCFGDSIYLFTKNWANQKTRVYALPKNPGSYMVLPVQTFDAGGLITASAFSPSGDQLALLGYIDFESFMWLFWDFDGFDFFSGKSLRVNFPELIFVQTEGLCFTDNRQLLISCEESAEFPTLFEVNSDELKLIARQRLGDYFSNEIVLSGMPPEVSNRLKVDILQIPEPEFSFEFRNTRWTKLLEGGDVKKEDQQKLRITIKTKDLENGWYFLKVSSGEHSIIKKVRVKH
ncbi:MAG: hypothetical protein K9H16_03095 [Bacteroidales bacterium]|nr:hypothetical protein [Bacteroidales bacterium]